MDMMSGFGLLVIVALVVAALSTLYGYFHEERLVSKGEIPPYNGDDQAQFKTLKQQGYKVIALRRIRKAALPDKINLKQARDIYDSL